nr:EOG090X0IGL [Sida crystallina]
MTAEKKSGKQATRGQKQIVEENASTLTFYRNMILGALGIHGLSCAIFWNNTFTLDIVLISLAAIVQFCGYRFMVYMARAKYSETGQLLDGGLDLNMESGVAEHVKDVIILTSTVEVLAVFTQYFWLLWLVAPSRLAWMAWKNFIGPWFFQSPPEQEVQDNEKKQKKLERRMKRQQH